MCNRVTKAMRRPSEWKENGRRYSLDCKENTAGRFLLCSVIDEDGKKRKLFFPEGRGLITGWTLLAKDLRGFGLKASLETRPSDETKFLEEEKNPRETKFQREEKIPREDIKHGYSFAETLKKGG